MKRAFGLILITVLLLSSVICLSSCDKGEIPKGRYVCEATIVDGLTYDIIYDVKEDMFLRVYEETDGYTVYEKYNFELNEDKTEITLSFDKYVYSGDESAAALSKINALKQILEFGTLGEGSKTFSFELGKDYFVLDGNHYDREDLKD